MCDRGRKGGPIPQNDSAAERDLELSKTNELLTDLWDFKEHYHLNPEGWFVGKVLTGSFQDHPLDGVGSRRRGSCDWLLLWRLKKLWSCGKNTSRDQNSESDLHNIFVNTGKLLNGIPFDGFMSWQLSELLFPFLLNPACARVCKHLSTINTCSYYRQMMTAVTTVLAQDHCFSDDLSE